MSIGIALIGAGAIAREQWSVGHRRILPFVGDLETGTFRKEATTNQPGNDGDVRENDPTHDS